MPLTNVFIALLRQAFKGMFEKAVDVADDPFEKWPLRVMLLHNQERAFGWQLPHGQMQGSSG